MPIADIKLGYSCNNNCIHCVIADYREICQQKGLPDDLDTEKFKEEMLDSRNRGADRIVFTGGEPTIRSDILHLLRCAKDLGYTIDMQTNGRRFCSADFARSVCSVAPINFCIALHAPLQEIHDSITRVPGSFRETIQGIRNLIDLRQSVSGKVVISRKNYRFLQETTFLLLQLGIGHISLTFPHGCGNARKFFLQVVPRYSEIEEVLHRSFDLCIAARINADSEAVPFCFLNGYEMFAVELALRRQTWQELKQYGEDKPINWAEERVRFKSKFPQCAACRFDPVCEGPWMEYPQFYGSDEFVPAPGEKVTDPEAILSGSFRQYFGGDDVLATLPAFGGCG